MGWEICFGQITFQRCYNYSGTGGGREVQQTSDGGYIVALQMQDGELIKLDAYGNVLWTKTYPFSVTCVKQLSDGGYILGGQRDTVYPGVTCAVIARTNSAGDTLWSKYYPSVYHGAFTYEVKITPDSNYLFTMYDDGQGTGNVSYLLIVDANGNTIWKLFMHPGITSQLTANGNIISVTTDPYGNGMHVEKDSSSGSRLWQQLYGPYFDPWLKTTYGNNILEVNDSIYLIAGMNNYYSYSQDNRFLMKVSAATGDSILFRVFGLGTFDKIQSTYDNGFAFIGFSDSAHCLFKHDSNLDSVWSKPFNSPLTAYPFLELINFEQTTDSGFIIIGIVYDQLFNDQLILIKTDSFGNSAMINSVSDNLITAPEFAIYPNPTIHNFTVKNIPSNETSLLQILNPLGKIVYSKNIFGQNEYVVEESFAKGIYFVRVNDVVMKLVIE